MVIIYITALGISGNIDLTVNIDHIYWQDRKVYPVNKEQGGIMLTSLPVSRS